MSLLSISLYSLIGVLAGLLAGILGIGGGIIVVPALVFVFQLTKEVSPTIQMHVAAGCSLAIMIFTAQSSARAHARQGKLLFDVFRRMWPWIVLGTVSGALLADLLNTRWLEVIFGIFLILIAFNMLFNINIEYAKKIIPNWIHRSVCFIIGLKSGLLGIGGGALIIPYLNYCGVDVKKIPGISALCTLIVSIIGTVVVIITGSMVSNLPPYSTGYIYWPAVFWIALFSTWFAPIGAKLTYRLPVKQLKYAFIGVLFVAALHLLY